MKILIATCAEWMPEREATLARLLELVPGATVLASRRREHAAIWARRLWEAGEKTGEDVCYLNDDVTVPERFSEILDAMAAAVPGKCLALHTSVPEATKVPGRWLRAYWPTGPGYVLTTAAHAPLLDYAADLPWQWHAVAGHNEDRVMIHWAWERQEPFWSSIPAVVRHDVTTKSSLGYDHHALRSSCVDWARDEEPYTSEQMIDPAFWRDGAEAPPFVENPWCQTPQLDAMRRGLAHPGVCNICWTRPGIMNRGGINQCGNCLHESIGFVLRNVRQT